jgi:hypothetical protein
VTVHGDGFTFSADDILISQEYKIVGLNGENFTFS